MAKKCCGGGDRKEDSMAELNSDEIITVMRIGGPNEAIFVGSPTGRRAFGVRSDRYYGYRRVNEPFDMAVDDFKVYQKRFPGYLQPIEQPKPIEVKRVTEMPAAPVRLESFAPIVPQDTKPPRFELRKLDETPIIEATPDEPLMADTEPGETPEQMTIGELADYFKVSEGTIRNRIRDNSIEPIEIEGRTPYYLLADIAIVI